MSKIELDTTAAQIVKRDAAWRSELTAARDCINGAALKFKPEDS